MRRLGRPVKASKLASFQIASSEAFCLLISVCVPTMRSGLPSSSRRSAEARSVSLVLEAGRAKASGTVRLELPQGWRAEPAAQPFSLEAAGDERTVSFRVTPPKGA